tara:strand:- start:15397 stop:17979 length:2583 start_codon:yes stop_codon:yes gene_type:complete
MNQFKNIFLGHDSSNYKRATSSQKCMRVSGKHNDLDNVGPSLRHHTFFEMLGNFSFGDYFKEEAIPFAWELLTTVWKIPPEKLYATVFGGTKDIPKDVKAHNIWKNFLPENHIIELGLSENFWSMGDTGPCGRCSELHYYRGDHIPCIQSTCRGLDCSCDRYIEIWNNVFMEFERHPDGTLSPLPAPSIDTGMGLERIVAVLQGQLSNYDTDLFTPILASIGEVTGTKYTQTNSDSDCLSNSTSMRVIADHMRAMTFLICDGVMPSNEWRGYVLRKIMRRAMRHGKKLGMTKPFLGSLVEPLVEQMSKAYPEMCGRKETIVQVITQEEERFDSVLRDGLPRLETIIEHSLSKHSPTLSGVDIFRLYDTYGLPIDFIEDLASEHNLELDREGFEKSLEGQRNTSRAGKMFKQRNESSFHYKSQESELILRKTSDCFEGYSTTRVKDAKILAIFDETHKEVDQLKEQQKGSIVLDRTPFYVESGGQVSDSGRIYCTNKSSYLDVSSMDTLKPSGLRTHTCTVTSGTFSVGMIVNVEVDPRTREATQRNHTATHLLHAALREILGTHVRQAGSLVEPERLRFDFTHADSLSPEQIFELEQRINRDIFTNHNVTSALRNKEDAIAEGATALFGEKYGDEVRVVSIENLSTELCGGTHCETTGEIGTFVITQENGIASGVRRIEAVTGDAAIKFLQQRRSILNKVLESLSASEHDVIQSIDRLQSSSKTLEKQLSQLKVNMVLDSNTNESLNRQEIDGIEIITQQVNDLDKAALRSLSDSLRDRMSNGVSIVVCVKNKKASLIVSVTKELSTRIQAGNIVKTLAPIINGRGGGRADFAEAGGDDVSRIDELLSEGTTIVKKLLSD